MAAFILRRPPNFAVKENAYPYQLDALRAVKDLPYAAIFHEQGLGKTKIAIDLITLWLKADVVDTVFVVTKKSLVENWRKEISIHCHLTPHVLSGNRRQNSASLNAPGLIYILNYEVVPSNETLFQMFLETCRVGCILDESQKIKNPEASLTQVYHELAQKFKRRIIMTGTPVANRPHDIWSQIKFLDNGQSLGTSFEQFKDDMDLPKEKQKESSRANNRPHTPNTNKKVVSSESSSYALRLSTIQRRIAPFTVRETKKTAGIQLPKKIINTRKVELPSWQRVKYTSYRDELAYQFRDLQGVITLDSAEGILKRLLRLVQCASNPALIDKTYDADPGKLPVLMKMCQEYTKESKVIVWTNFVENVMWLQSRLNRFNPVYVHGGLSTFDRNKSIDKFKNSFNSILIATPGAAKEGLTLTVANHTIFFDRSFSLDDYLQAQDRIHRISQDRPCYVHNLIAIDTIDEWVDVLLNAKYRAGQMAQGDIEIEQFQETYRTDISELLNEVLSA